MRLKFSVLIALSSSLICASAVHAENLPPLLRNVHRIVALGDSITQFGDGPQGYVGIIRNTLQKLYPDQNFEVINAGISGNKSNQMLARFQQDVIDKNPDMVTISCGVNDVWHGFYDNHPKGDGPRGIPIPKYRANIEKMISMAEAAHIRVVILSTTVIYEDPNSPENLKVKGYNAALEEIAKKRHLPFVNFQPVFWRILLPYRATGATALLLTVDGVHMNNAGNQLMAYTILKGLGIKPDEWKNLH